MNCTDSRVLIKPYLDNKLDSKNMKRLIAHVDECPNCKDELKLQFFLREGLSRLEHGGNLDLQKDFEKNINDSRVKVRTLGILNSVSLVLFTISSLLTLAALIAGII